MPAKAANQIIHPCIDMRDFQHLSERKSFVILGADEVNEQRLAMSAIGPKRTSLVAPHMSAFGGKADMTICGNLLSRSLLGKADMPFCTANVGS